MRKALKKSSRNSKSWYQFRPLWNNKFQQNYKGDEKLVRAALDLGADLNVLSKAGLPIKIVEGVNSGVYETLGKALKVQDTTVVAPSLMSRLCCSRRAR